MCSSREKHEKAVPEYTKKDLLEELDRKPPYQETTIGKFCRYFFLFVYFIILVFGCVTTLIGLFISGLVLILTSLTLIWLSTEIGRSRLQQNRILGVFKLIEDNELDRARIKLKEIPFTNHQRASITAPIVIAFILLIIVAIGIDASLGTKDETDSKEVVQDVVSQNKAKAQGGVNSNVEKSESSSIEDVDYSKVTLDQYVKRVNKNLKELDSPYSILPSHIVRLSHQKGSVIVRLDHAEEYKDELPYDLEVYLDPETDYVESISFSNNLKSLSDEYFYGLSLMGICLVSALIDDKINVKVNYDIRYQYDRFLFNTQVRISEILYSKQARYWLNIDSPGEWFSIRAYLTCTPSTCNW